MRVSLVIAGDASGAKQAAQETQAALSGVSTQSATTAKAVAENASKASGALGQMSAAATGAAGAKPPPLPSTEEFTKRVGLARHELVNLSRQAQDIAVSLAGGMSPLTVLMQQGSQVFDIFQSSKGSIGGFGAQVLGVLTPARLLGGVVGLAATAFAGAAISVGKSSLALDDLARSTDQSVTKLHGLEQAASFKGIDSKAFSEGITGFADQVYQAQRNFGSLNGLMKANGQSAKDFQGYLGGVADLVARATSDMQKQKILREAGLPSDMAWVRFMEQGSKGIAAAVAGTVQFNASAEANMVRKAREFDEAWNMATTKMVSYFKSGVIDIVGALSSVKVPDWLLKVGSGAAGVLGGLPVVGAAFQGARLAGSLLPGSTPTAQYPGSEGVALKPGAQTLWRSDYDWGGKNEPKTSQELLTANQQAQQRIGLLGQLATVEDQVRAKQLELDAAALQGVGVSAKQRDAILGVVRAQAEMSRVSQQASIGVYDQAKAQQAANDQLKAWVDQKLVDPTNSQQMAAAQTALAKAMRDVADAASVAGSALPGLQQSLNEIGNANKQLDSLAMESRSVNSGFWVEFNQNIRNGASGFDALAKAGLNALGRISDKLMSMAADQLWASAFGGSGGGGSIFSLFGFGDSGASSMAQSASTLANNTGGAFYGPGFDLGGYTGPGGKHEPAGVVHKDEYVFDQASVRAAGVGNLARLHRRLRGYAGGGLVGQDSSMMAAAGGGAGGVTRVAVDVGVSVDDDGKFSAYVKRVSTQAANESVAGFASSPQFVDHVATASQTARSRRLG